MKEKLYVKDVITLWEKEKEQYVKASTYATYRVLIEKHIVPYFGEKEKFEEIEVQGFVLYKLQNGMSQKTIKDILMILKMIMKYGAKKNFWPYQTFDIRFPTTKETKKLEIFSIEEQKKIFKYVKEHFSFENLGIYICLCTGIRIGEICALTWNDIDIENEVIYIRKTLQRIYYFDGNKKTTRLMIDFPKTSNSIREIPIMKELLQVLKPLKKIVQDNFYVLSNDSLPIEPRSYRNYYKKLLQKLDISIIKFHSLRHSFATRCVESKCDYKTISVILGHASINTTMNLYVHPNREQKKKCIHTMTKIFR